MTKAQGKPTPVVCACIRRRGGKEILLTLRQAPGVPGLHGKWELPGGKIEPGETPEQSITREIREETGLQVTPLRLLPYLHTNFWEYEDGTRHVVLACYECHIETSKLAYFGRDIRWFHFNEIDFDSTLPGTREFVSLAVGNKWFGKLDIRFEYVDPSRNRFKQFSIATQPTLFSEFGLVKYWGRIGSLSRVQIKGFDSPQELDNAILGVAKLRLAHGYKITELAGPERPYKALLRIIELAKEKNRYQVTA